MPEINLKVRVVGGKRTEFERYVDSIDNKEITLPDGTIISSNDLEIVIDRAIIDYVENGLYSDIWYRR